MTLSLPAVPTQPTRPSNELRLEFFLVGERYDAVSRIVDDGVRSARLLSRTEYALTSETGERIVLDDWDLFVHLFGDPERALEAASTLDPMLANRLAYLYAVDIPQKQESLEVHYLYCDRASRLLPDHNDWEIPSGVAMSRLPDHVQDELEVTLERAAVARSQRWLPYSAQDFMVALFRYRAPTMQEVRVLCQGARDLHSLFNCTAFTPDVNLVSQPRLSGGRACLSIGYTRVLLSPCELAYMMGGYKRFARYVQIASAVTVARMETAESRRVLVRDTETLTSLMGISAALAQHVQTEALWRNSGADVALDDDAGDGTTPALEPAKIPDSVLVSVEAREVEHAS